jgi:hypothetical protein
MRTTLSRREFLRNAALLAVSSPTVARRNTHSAIALSLGIIDTGTHDSRIDGATLGVEEARHAASLFGGTIALVHMTPNARVPQGLTALLGDADLDHARAFLNERSLGDALFMNVACTADGLRAEDCRRTAFHVTASDAMRRDAIAAANDDASAAVVWDPSLAKFGADTLNERFHTRFGTPMTEDAWTAWFAVKVLWESSLRVKSGDSRAIADYLVRETTQFDGHKGRPLSFRAWDHQLRQPLYVRTGSRVLEEPVTRDGEPARNALDRLGPGASASKCGMSK